MIISGFCREVRPGPLSGWKLTHTLEPGRGRYRATCTDNWMLGPNRWQHCLQPAPLYRAPYTQVFNELPLEFAAEVNQLMSLKLEGSVG